MRDTITAKDQAEAIRTIKADRETALKIAREIRDRADAADADRLEAIRIIEELTHT